MEIEFSSHASIQLKERNLSQIEVERAVRKPHKLIEQSLGRYRAVRSIRKGGKHYLLVVIYDSENLKKEVVTAFFTTKFKKYL